jgi:hypothetical protein
MKYEYVHLSDEQLLAEIDGELSAQDGNMARAHLQVCPTCRVRRQELQSAAANLAHVSQRRFDIGIPPADGPRAMLEARLRQIDEIEPVKHPAWSGFGYQIASAAAIGGLVAVALAVWQPITHRSSSGHRTAAVFSLPDSNLTPGAAIPIDRQVLCAEDGANNKSVSASMQRQVFEEYRIAGADPRAYEVDYLITPALGGADDIRNLWPHSYSSTVWNARTKDALESHLRNLVCGGNLDLAEAQREIASNWIAAYKKYFRTEEPLSEHRKDPE